MLTKAYESIKNFFGAFFAQPPEENKGSAAKGPVELSRPFTLLEGCDQSAPLLKEIMEKDLRGLKTPLELMKRYADKLNKGTSYGNIDEKLDKLFLCGRIPESLNGYYHGITIGLQTGTDSFKTFEGLAEKLGVGTELDPLQVFYGTLLSKTSPWAGKNFKKLGKAKLGKLTDDFDKGEETSYLGINSFRKDRKDVVNNLSGYILSTVMDMEGVPGPKGKQSSWIYSKGGLFIAKRRMSVDPKHPEKEVIALNYRWKSLGNKFPNKLLIDEIVAIADGLYLGKLYYATALGYLMKDFDPTVDIKDYNYRGFGYFLLMDDSWLHEKNMLFPDLTYKLSDKLPEKFEKFRFAEDAPTDKVAKIKVRKGKTVLHYLQNLSKGVKEGSETEEKYFSEIHNLFICAEPPDSIEGYFHGGVVAFKSSWFLKKLGTNVLNDLWPKARPFSPWTGKTFTEVPLERVQKYLGEDAEYYKEKAPLILGTNTYRKDLDLSLATTVFIEHLDKIGMVVEYPDEREKEEGVYVKSFYFIADFAKSVSSECAGKSVLQFNYRWPKFHTMPPDYLCIDELVRIADGLYLGQLLYSTRPDMNYSPEKDPAVYEYENFGYFMLMDEEWFAIKEFIAFDTEMG